MARTSTSSSFGGSAAASRPAASTAGKAKRPPVRDRLAAAPGAKPGRAAPRLGSLTHALTHTPDKAPSKALFMLERHITDTLRQYLEEDTAFVNETVEKAVKTAEKAQARARASTLSRLCGEARQSLANVQRQRAAVSEHVSREMSTWSRGDALVTSVNARAEEVSGGMRSAVEAGLARLQAAMDELLSATSSTGSASV